MAKIKFQRKNSGSQCGYKSEIHEIKVFGSFKNNLRKYAEAYNQTLQEFRLNHLPTLYCQRLSLFENVRGATLIKSYITSPSVSRLPAWLMEHITHLLDKIVSKNSRTVLAQSSSYLRTRRFKLYSH